MNRGLETPYTGSRTLGSLRVGVSRALPVALKNRLLAKPGTVELPVLRGITVVPDGWSGTVIFGHPNYFGRFEPPCGCEHEIRYTGAWASLRDMPERADPMQTADPVPAAFAEQRLADARLIARRLGQLPGVQVAVRIQSPIVVVVTPGIEVNIETSIAGTTILGRDFPEYPGGLRIELPADVGDFDVVRYAGALEQFLRQEE